MSPEGTLETSNDNSQHPVLLIYINMLLESDRRYYTDANDNYIDYQS